MEDKSKEKERKKKRKTEKDTKNEIREYTVHDLPEEEALFLWV